MVDLERPAVAAQAPPESRYFSRELSLLLFHERVRDQTLDTRHPLLERVKFLAISDSNLDEFLSIHYSLLLGNVEVGDTALTPDGFTQMEQVRRVRDALRPFMREQRRIFHEVLVPQLDAAGIYLRRYVDLPAERRATLREWFLSEVFPICTPLAVDPAHPFPFMSHLSLNLGVVLGDSRQGLSFARLKVPDVLPRLVRVPGDAGGERRAEFVWLEDILSNNLDAFFPGIEVRSVSQFRIVRHADLELEQMEEADLREQVQAGVRRRRFGDTVCVQLAEPLPDTVREQIITRLDVYPEDVYVTGGPLGLKDLMPMLEVDRPDLKDPLLLPRVPPVISSSRDMFGAIRQRDLLLHHPYESFGPVHDLIAQAAADPDVVAIKQTLYRIGKRSPLIHALLDAVDRGKQVAVVLELQARGDEEYNLEWAQTLERAGAHVSYGVIGLKTHVKLALIVRREMDALRRYVHVGTGNYSASPYADLSLFTCHPGISADVTELFNVLTGRSRQDRYRHLLVAPVVMRRGLLERIEREIEAHRRDGNGHIIIKANALVDIRVIDALYAASREGVRLDLIIRGMCCLRPGVPGLSETVRVTSIVGRFLEHSRIYYFHNGGEEEVLIGSADVMERNLDRRIEALAPILEPDLARAVKSTILDLQLRDNARATFLGPDGVYRHADPNGVEPVDAQLLWTTTPLSLMR